MKITAHLHIRSRNLSRFFRTVSTQQTQTVNNTRYSKFGPEDHFRGHTASPVQHLDSSHSKAIRAVSSCALSMRGEILDAAPFEITSSGDNPRREDQKRAAAYLSYGSTNAAKGMRYATFNNEIWQVSIPKSKFFGINQNFEFVLWNILFNIILLDICSQKACINMIINLWAVQWNTYE